MKEFKIVIEKTKSFNLKIEAVFEILHIAILNKDMVLLKEYLDICNKFLTTGGDWEKRNKLRVNKFLFIYLNFRFTKV